MWVETVFPLKRMADRATKYIFVREPKPESELPWNVSCETSGCWGPFSRAHWPWWRYRSLDELFLRNVTPRACSSSFSCSSCDPQKHSVSLFQTSQDKTELQMVSAASVSFLGPAEESPYGLFLPCAPVQLCSSLWQMAEPDLSQVTALCQHLEFCPEALGPQDSALGPVLLLHTHLLRCSQAASRDSSC